MKSDVSERQKVTTLIYRNWEDLRWPIFLSAWGVAQKVFFLIFRIFEIILQGECRSRKMEEKPKVQKWKDEGKIRGVNRYGTDV